MLCGDLGHTNRDGRLCKKRQGWGTEGVYKGACCYHDGRDQGTRDDIQRALLQYLRNPELTLEEICRKVGRAPNTIWRWRQQDKEFGKECSAALASANEARVHMVEEAMFLKIVAGNASSRETIFWLVNRAPERWKRKAVRENTLLGGGAKISIEVLRSFIKDK